MASKSINYYLLKIGRISGWTLMALMAIYIVTGFSLCGKLGVNRVIDTQTALIIHQLFDWPLVAAFAVHAATSVYFAMKRWRWIKK
jgi:succinate dehydrogenase/fumarate reductase cytochrome b subunit